MLKKITYLLVLFFVSNSLFAEKLDLIQNRYKNVEAEYKVTYSVFGEVAYAKASLKIDSKGRFIIRSEAESRGVVNTLLGKRKDNYYTRGIIHKDEFLPFEFIKIIKTEKKHSKKVYKFKHRQKKVVVESELAKKEQNWKLKKWTKNSKFYATTDVLSLFFNFVNIFHKFKDNHVYSFKTIGTNPKTGILKIIFPSQQEKREIQRTLNTKSEKIFKINMQKKLFYSKNGELLVALGKDGFCEKAILKDVAMLGDVLITRVK
jgi:hypothetical protein